MKILLLDIAWFAGLMEGEGSFYIQKNKYNGSIKLALQMTDYDIMVKCSKLLNTTLHGPYTSKQLKKDGTQKKETWLIGIFGSKAAQWMMTIYPFMGKRRQEKIKEILDFWCTQPVVRSGRSATCHPDQPRYAKDLCSVCYNKEYHANFAS